jgi:uncharacterized protein
MQCPVCQSVDLVMSERNGIEIDYCPKCRGVWLDRGELDKIIERSIPATPTPSPRNEREEKSSYRDDGRYEKSHYGHPKKKESFLGELFDF